MKKGLAGLQETIQFFFEELGVSAIEVGIPFRIRWQMAL